MMETLFVQLGGLLVNISKVNFFRPAAVPHVCYVYFQGSDQAVEINIGIEAVGAALAETYQQMAMMQAAASKAYGAKGSS